MKAILVAAAMTSALIAGTAYAQNQNQEGLVNVAVGNIGVDALNNTNVQVPIGIAAQVCGVDANVIAQQGDDAVADCEVTQESANTAFMNYVSEKTGSTGGDNQNQEGLVNVAVGDIGVDALNNTNVQVPIGIAAQVCGVDANSIAEQGDDAVSECRVTQESANTAFMNYVSKKN
jgi:hypothetical protein